MKIIKVRGNLTGILERSEVDVIIHGCNCFHIMGAGVAKALNRATEGRLSKVDKQSRYGDINKLGKFTSTIYNNVNIFNLYTQHSYGNTNGAIFVHWDSFEIGLFNILFGLSVFEGRDSVDIAIPYIGCGLAGGKEQDFWNAVNKVNDELTGADECRNFKLFVVEYQERV